MNWCVFSKWSRCHFEKQLKFLRSTSNNFIPNMWLVCCSSSLPHFFHKCRTLWLISSAQLRMRWWWRLRRLFCQCVVAIAHARILLWLRQSLSSLSLSLCPCLSRSLIHSKSLNDSSLLLFPPQNIMVSPFLQMNHGALAAFLMTGVCNLIIMSLFLHKRKLQSRVNIWDSTPKMEWREIHPCLGAAYFFVPFPVLTVETTLLFFSHLAVLQTTYQTHLSLKLLIFDTRTKSLPNK